MFEIKPDHISALDSDQARELIVRLATSELRRSGQAISGVLAGGDGRAPDGGVDVRVNFEGSSGIDFVSRPFTIFQSKAEKIGSAKIRSEMRDSSGGLRAFFVDLAKNGGAYVIVSTKSSDADRSHLSKIAAMRAELEDLTGSNRVHLDFYGRERLAAWANEYFGVQLWLRDCLGIPLLNWRGYGDWSAHEEGDDGYILDSHARLQCPTDGASDALPTVRGIEAIRGRLTEPGGVVRLVGLSGVGKTRLVQSLFEHDVGSDPLNPDWAIYTDAALTPEPPAAQMMARLQAKETNAILIIDNCSVAEHDALVRLRRSSFENVRILTVEYDITDGVPESTGVYRLEPASREMLAMLVRRWRPTLGLLEADRVVDAAGGNARIARSILNQFDQSESLTGLSDNDLFNRLFRQNQTDDPKLKHAARALSMFYSLSDQDTAEGPAEIASISDLVEMSHRTLRRHIATLRQRDLIQTRGPWRALLPHALAERLCKEELMGWDPSELVAELVSDEFPTRLFMSFAHRIGVLHDHPRAIEIAEACLAESGYLGILSQLDDIQFRAFTYLAPVAPGFALAVVERDLSNVNGSIAMERHGHRRYQVALIVRHIARIPGLFRRVADALSLFARAELDENRSQSTRDLFSSLFQIQFAGANATLRERLDYLDAYRTVGEDAHRILALDALETALKTEGLSFFSEAEFGTRLSSRGHQPTTNAEIDDWCRSILNEIGRLLDVENCRDQAMQMLARQFSGLWRHTRCQAEIASLFRQIAGAGFWRDGWLAVGNLRDRNSRERGASANHVLAELHEELSPPDFVSEIRAFLGGRFWDVIRAIDEASGRTASERLLDGRKHLEKLAARLAEEPDALDLLLPDLVAIESREAAFHIGKAIGATTSEFMRTWEKAVEAFDRNSIKTRSHNILRGMLFGHQPQDATTTNEVLDAALDDHRLSDVFPNLQCTVHLDQRAFDRLHASIDKAEASAWQYSGIRRTDAGDDETDSQLAFLLPRIAALPDGAAVAIDLLHLWGHGHRRPARALTDVAATLLTRLDLSVTKSQSGGLDYEVAQLFRIYLSGSQYGQLAGRLMHRLIIGVMRHDLSPYDVEQMFNTILELHPNVSLHEIFSIADDESLVWQLSMMHFDDRRPLDSLDTKAIIGWADQDPEVRFKKLAPMVQIFEKAGEPKKTILSSKFLKLLAASPDKGDFLRAASGNFRPVGGWSGSLVEILEGRRDALATLGGHHDASVVGVLEELLPILDAMIDQERVYEARREAERTERFE